MNAKVVTQLFGRECIGRIFQCDAGRGVSASPSFRSVVRITSLTHDPFSESVAEAELWDAIDERFVSTAEIYEDENLLALASYDEDQKEWRK